MNDADDSYDLPAALAGLQQDAHANYVQYRNSLTGKSAPGFKVLPRVPSNATAAAQMIAYNENEPSNRKVNLPATPRRLSQDISAWTRGSRRPSDIGQLWLLVRVYAKWADRTESRMRWANLLDASTRQTRKRRGGAWLFLGDDAEAHVQRRGRGHRTHVGAGDYFHGRETALSHIKHWLKAATFHGRPLVVTGQPGAGKSAVLARVALTHEPATDAKSSAQHLFFHARAQSNNQLLAAIAARAALAHPTPSNVDDLLQGLGHLDSSGPTLLVLVVDALDEAVTTTEARAMANTLYILASAPQTQVLVGTRRRSASVIHHDPTSLLTILGIRSATANNLIDLDTDTYADQAALQAYAQDLLIQRDQPAQSLADLAWRHYRDHPETTELLAQAIAQRAASNFLVAAITATTLARNPHDPKFNPERLGFDPEQLPATIGEALTRYFDSLDSPSAALFRQLLAALALARGDGFTDQLWVDVVRAITPGDTTTSGHHLNELRDTAAADFLLQNTLDDEGVRVTRLFHQALVDDLTDDANTVGFERKMVSLLTDSVARAGGWQHANYYARQHIPSHALAAGRLPDLLADADAAVYITPGNLLRAVYALPATGRTANSMVVEYAGDLFANEPSPQNRGDILTLAAAHLGLTEVVPDYVTTPPLHPKWAHTAGPLCRTLSGHDSFVTAVAIGQLGDRDVIVSGGDDGTVRIWDDDGNSLGRPLTGHDLVTTVAVGKLGDQDVIVSAGDDDGTIRVWDRDGQPLALSLAGHDGLVEAVAVGRLGSRDVVVSAGDDHTVRIWNQDGQPVGQPLTGHEEAVTAVAIGRRGNHDVIVSAGDDHTVRIWNQDGQPVGQPLTGHEEAVTAVAIGRLGNHDTIVSGGADGTVRLWDQEGHPLGQPLSAHEGTVRAVAVGRLRDRATIVTSGADGMVWIWDEDLQPVGQPLTGHDSAVDAVAIGQLGGRDVVISGGSDDNVRIWDQQVEPLGRPMFGNGDTVRAATIGRLGNRNVIVSGGADRTVRIWDMNGSPIGQPLTGHDGDVKAVAVGRLGDRDVIVSSASTFGGHGSGVVQLWDEDGQPLGQPLTEHGAAMAVAIGRLGERDVIVAGYRDGTVRVCDEHGQPVLQPLTGHDGAIAIAIGRLGERDVIVSGGRSGHGGGSVLVWDQDGQPVGQPLTGHDGPVNVVAVGRLHGRDVIISGGSYDGTVRIYDQDGRGVGSPLTGHDGEVTAVAVGRVGDCDIVLSTGDDGTVRLWDHNGQLVQRLSTYAPCNSVSLIPSGAGAVIASGRSLIYFQTHSDKQECV